MVVGLQIVWIMLSIPKRRGTAEQAEWTRRQEPRLVPVPYYLLMSIVPQLKDVMKRVWKAVEL